MQILALFVELYEQYSIIYLAQIVCYSALMGSILIQLYILLVVPVLLDVGHVLILHRIVQSV
jgi:hypothetical protein